MSFDRNINKVVDSKADGLIENVVRKVALDTQRDVSASTPVDTGRARSNWFVTAGRPSSQVTDAVNGSPTAALSPTKVAFVTNNLPYIERLENGHSGQAPSGFVGSVVRRQVNKVREIVKQL